MITKTSLLTFRYCPMAYKLQFIDKKLPEEDSLRLMKGINFHRFVCTFFENVDIDKCRNLTLRELENVFSNLVRTNLKVTEAAAKRFTTYEARRFAYLRDNNLIRLFKPYAMELELYCEKLDIAGRIDRLDELPDGTYRLYEYKPQAFDLATMRLEFAFYLLLLGCALPKKTISSTVCFEYNTGNLIDVAVASTTVRSLARWLDLFREAQERDEYERKVTDNCVTCELLTVCNPFDSNFDTEV